MEETQLSETLVILDDAGTPTPVQDLEKWSHWIIEHRDKHHIGEEELGSLVLQPLTDSEGKPVGGPKTLPRIIVATSFHGTLPGPWRTTTVRNDVPLGQGRVRVTDYPTKDVARRGHDDAVGNAKAYVLSKENVVL